jgi:hypothetical protein
MSLDTLRQITSDTLWRAIAETIVSGREAVPGTPEAFGTYWIEAGHRMREQIADDRLLCQLLRIGLPPYRGGSVKLYRGENIDRCRNGNVGLSWTPKIETARMFGRGLNAYQSGGVLLCGLFAPSGIIAGPNSHSIYLQEEQYTVDPALVDDLQELERYPAV